jgi:hypothetical protein
MSAGAAEVRPYLDEMYTRATSGKPPVEELPLRQAPLARRAI